MGNSVRVELASACFGHAAGAASHYRFAFNQSGTGHSEPHGAAAFGIRGGISDKPDGGPDTPGHRAAAKRSGGGAEAVSPTAAPGRADGGLLKSHQIGRAHV